MKIMVIACLAGNNCKDRKGIIMTILSQMGANFEVQQFEDVENIVISFNPSNKRLVVGAHWDADEDSDGANDNASGCSVLLHTIEALLAKPTFEKSVDFVFFGEEEKGGIGASRYIESVGKENISAMVNADVCALPIPSLWVVPVHQPQASGIVH